MGDAALAPGDEQGALRRGLDGADAPEELVAGHPRHPLVRDDQRDLVAVLLEPGNGVEGGGCRGVGATMR